MKTVTVRPFATLMVIVCASAMFPLSASAQLPGARANQRATVLGRLELAGRNYFLDPRFVIVDDNNDRVFVSAWAPLEVPPPMPGKSPPRTLKTMKDFVGRRLSVSGIYRAGIDLPEKAKAVSAPGQDFIEIDSVIDVATATQVYTRAKATGAREETPAAAPIVGTTKTGQAPIAPQAAPQPSAPQKQIVPQPASPARPATPPPGVSGILHRSEHSIAVDCQPTQLVASPA